MDIVAEGIAGIASAQRSGLGLYHMVNPHHDDGVSLDTIVRWVQSAGYPLRFIDDYDQWCVLMPHNMVASDLRATLYWQL